MKHSLTLLVSGLLLLAALAVVGAGFHAFWPAGFAAGLLVIAGFGVLSQLQAAERKPCPVRVRRR